MKRIFLILMLCSLISLRMQAADGDTFTATTVEGIEMTFRVISENEKTVKVGVGNGAAAISQAISGKVTIPGEVVYNDETYIVTVVELNAFYKCSITTIQIPNSITKIGQSAFANCTSLESVSIPNSVTVIDGAAFDSCTGLTSVTIPESVTKWGNSVFYGCTSLVSIHIPSNTIMNSSQTFAWCRGLKSITFSDKVTMIGQELFHGCTGLESIDIPSNIKTIQKGAFSGCSSLASVTFHEGLETIEDAAFNDCDALTSLTMPNSVASIGSKILSSDAFGTFAGCDNLKEVTLNNNLTCIPSYGFYGCKSLTSINMPTGLKEIGDRAFNCCTSLIADIVLPFGTEYIGVGAFAVTNISSIKIPNTVTYFAANALHGNVNVKKVIVPSLEQWCSQIDFNSGAVGAEWHTIGLLHYADLYIEGHEDTPIRDVVIPNGVKRINRQAFYDASITSVEIPSSVDSIYYGAFNYCENLKEIKFHEGLRFIGNDAFHSCKSLETLRLPDGLIELGEAFYQCTGLKSIEIANSVTVFNTTNQGIFKGCSSLESIKFGTGMSEIPYSMFIDCTNLKFVEIPNNITKIGMGAFGGCKRLKKIIFPNSVEETHQGCFMYCDSLTQVIVPDFNIADWCGKFLSGGPMRYTHHIYDTEGNDLIVDAVIPEGVTFVNESAFEGCESMVSLTLPSTLSSIGRLGFAYCSNLKSVTCKMKEPDVNINAFQFFAGISPECVLYVPSGTKETYIAKGWTEDIFKGGIVEFEDEEENPEYEDVTAYIVNPRFDEDLTFQTDGSYKEIIDKETSLSERTWAWIAADSSVYAHPKATSSQQRKDGLDKELAVNGFIGRIKGWTIETNQTFPKCEWVYFGSIPYALAPQAIPIADDGDTFLGVPEKPAEDSGEENVGAVYLRAGWGGSCVYKQEVKLPCAQYRLEYWVYNLNYEGSKNNTGVKNLCKVSCRKDEFIDEDGFNTQEWTKHSIEFTPTSDFTIQFGFESSGGSASNPFLFIDGIKLYKIGEYEEPHDGDLYYEYDDENQTATVISGEKKYEGDIIIPEAVEHNGVIYAVTAIGDGAFQECDGLTSVDIPNSVTSIAGWAFWGSWGLTDMTIPASVTSIGESAFRYTGLSSIQVESGNPVYDSRDNCNAIIETATNTLILGCENSFIPDGITAIGGAAFSGSWGLTSVTIPESVTSIGWTAFEDTGLSSVTIPNSVTSIGSYAFSGTALSTVFIPKSVTFIDQGAFSGYNMTSIELEEGNPVYDSRDNCNAIIETASNTLIEGWEFSTIPNGVTTIGPGAFVYCGGLTSIDIPNSVTSIESNAFWGAGLTSVTIPSSVKSIGGYAFYCSSLTDMYCYSRALPKTEWEIFMDVDFANATLHVPASAMKAYSSTAPWSNFGTIVALDDEPVIVGDANNDGEVDITDVVAVVNYILGKPSDKFNFDGADVNADGTVDIVDVVAVVNIILGKGNQAKAREAVVVAGTLTTMKENGCANIVVDGAANYVAMQFDVVVPEGRTLMDVKLNSASDHAMVFNRTGENRYTVLAYSLSNEAFEQTDAALATLKLSDGEAAAIEHATFITTEGRGVSMNITDMATGIEFVNSSQLTVDSDAIYNMTGQRVKTLQKGVNIIRMKDGKTKTVFVK